MTERRKTTAYSFDQTTGEFIGTADAWESPLEPETYHLPGHSTFDAPPERTEHKTPCWDLEQGKWVKKDDYRGDVYYDTATKERHEIKELDTMPDADWTGVAPTDPESEWDAEPGEWVLPFPIKKARKIAWIQAESNRRIAAVRQGYTDGEIQSFEQQHIGALYILSGDETTTEAQFVLALLEGRLGHAPTAEAKTAFATLICNNYNTAATASAAIVGTQQRLELQARAAETEADLDAIAWPEEE